VRVGSAVLKVVQPRQPCYKLQIRLGGTTLFSAFW